jgi:hypothetical protein
LCHATEWLRSLTFEEAARQTGLVRGEEVGPVTEAVAGAGRRYEHPFYWAGFILIGEPGDLSPVATKAGEERVWPWAAGALVVAGMGSSVWLLRRRRA